MNRQQAQKKIENILTQIEKANQQTNKLESPQEQTERHKNLNYALQLRKFLREN